MKIAVDLSQIVYSGTGVGRYVDSLARALVNQGGADYLFYAGALRQLPTLKKLSKQLPLNQANWKITPFSPVISDLIFNQIGLSIDPLLGHVDIFHSSDWTQPASRALKITTVHDLAFRLYPETIDPLVLRTQTLRMKRVVKHTDFIVADSASTKNDLVKIYGLSSHKIKVVYPGISSIFKPAKYKEIERVKNKYHLPDQFILSVGTQEPRKNLTRLAAAAEIVKLPLILVGRDGWGDKTTTLGFVSDEDLPPLYSAASVFAYPSLYEGFGFPVAESMACGTPTLTSNISSLPEVGGNAAVLVNPNDVKSIAAGIIQAIKEKEARRKAGIKQAAKFTWDKTATEMLNIYRKVVNENRH